MSFHKWPNIYVSEVHLKVSNLERALSFYTEVIGFKVLIQTDNKATLTADGETPLLIIEEPLHVSPKESRKTGLFHFALLLPTRSDLAAVLKYLIKINYPIGASDHLVSEALYLSDPDGNGIKDGADTMFDSVQNAIEATESAAMNAVDKTADAINKQLDRR